MNRGLGSEKTAYSPTAKEKKYLEELKKTKASVARYIEKFEFHLAAETVYHYIWHTFADMIIEGSKPRLASKKPEVRASTYRVVETIFVECLKMLHPFMPFLTEEIFGKFRPGKLLLTEKW